MPLKININTRSRREQKWASESQNVNANAARPPHHPHMKKHFKHPLSGMNNDISTSIFSKMIFEGQITCQFKTSL